MTILKYRQLEQRLKFLQPDSPEKKWSKPVSLLSLSTHSGDLKWGQHTSKKHERQNIRSTGYYANVMGSPRGDVELADFSNNNNRPSSLQTPRVFSPVRKSIDYEEKSKSIVSPVLKPRSTTNALAFPQTPQRSTPVRSISPIDNKMYISPITKRHMRQSIQEHGFPLTVANMAYCLLNSKPVLNSILDSTHCNNEGELMGGLMDGLMTISLSEEESDRDTVRRQKCEGYKAALGGFVTRGNDDFVSCWEECEVVLGEVFLWSGGGRIMDDLELDEEKKEEEGDIEVAPAAAVTDALSAVGGQAATSAAIQNKQTSSAVITLASTTTPIKRSKKRYMQAITKVLPKKARPSLAKVKSKQIQSQKKKKEPCHLSLDNFRKMIENKVGPSKWNRVFNRPHHLTPPSSVIQEHEAKLYAQIESLEKSRPASSVDDVLARLQQEEQARQASERASSLLRPLTTEEESIVQNALYGIGPPNDILASQDADSVQRSSMQRLQPGQWLNDEIINYFLKNCLAKRDEKLCASQPGRKRSHFFNSYFVQTLFDEKNNNAALRGKYAYKNVKRWSKKVPGKDVFNLKYIFCPINVDNMHWTSAVIFMEEKKIQYFDSMGGTEMNKLEGLLEYLKDEWRAKKGGEMDVSGWRLVRCTPDTPQQKNGELVCCLDCCDELLHELTLFVLFGITLGYDCGVFTCMFSDFISNDCPLVFDQRHVNQCRERIALSIMKNCAIE
jgi:sentrin-specific protease 1